MKLRTAHLAVTAAIAVAATACSTPPGATALYDTSASRAEFFALPWPSDARLLRAADNHRHIDLELGIPRGFATPGFAIGAYLDALVAEPLDGFGTQAAIYFRFDAPLDPASLPASAAASLGRDASVLLVDTTRGSPTYGRRAPIRVSFHADAGRYIGANWLALLPEPGFPLREGTTYTAVVTRAARAADGGELHDDPRFQPARAALDAAALTVPVDDVVVATTFTTQSSTHEMRDLRDAVYAQAAPPTVADLARVANADNDPYDLYTGTFESPNFQEGEPPYTRTGGRIHRGPDGKPTVVRSESLRFALTVPRAPMPATGWPVVLYAHGTGGDYETFIADGSARSAALVKDRAGKVIARMAMISIDQVLHGPRDPSGSDPDLTFFNFQNIVAARDNPKQGALDDFQLVRLVDGVDVAAAPESGAPIRFDKERIYFKGHSQGGFTGPLFLAFEPKVKAAVLSGAGAGVILALLHKTQPSSVAHVVEAIIGEPIDEYHPLLTMLQTFFDGVDPGNYARYFFRDPPPGVPVKSIYQSLGVVDHYTPVPTIKALALAMGVQPAGPAIEPLDTLDLTSLTWGVAPLAGNVASGAATGVLCEYKVPVDGQGRQRYDGHFVVFQDPVAVEQSNAFLALHAASGSAQLIK